MLGSYFIPKNPALNSLDFLDKIMKYNPQKIEKKWQNIWKKQNFKSWKALDFSKKPKYYPLVEFPYPSGDGLHVGHCRSYTALDIIARKRRMEGKNVLYPIGWDAFGLPTENYAIKKGVHPAIITKKNIAVFKKQLQSMGISFDWSREINTTDSNYYKWTQWIFLQFFKHGLAYRAEMPINWCPSCKIGLANEEVIEGKCERCGAATIKRKIKQWMLKITAYADRLIKDLDTVDYLDKIKTQQINWIGRSEGTTIKFKIQNLKSEKKSKQYIEVFTTRVDTIFGCTYMVIAPENPIIEKLKPKIQNWTEANKYIEESKKKSDLQRTELEKEKIGIELKGIKVINPFNKQEIPVFIADYVLTHYGTGAVMAVPAHDDRDFAFAKKYNLPIKVVIMPPPESTQPYRITKQGEFQPESISDESNPRHKAYLALQKEALLMAATINDGILIDSDQFTNLRSEQARQKMTEWLEKNNLGEKKVNFKLRDWIFSRQHYWGEPIPIIHCPKCGEVAVPEKDLPIKLPNIKNYQPTDTGESPLASITKWVNVKCPKCKGPAKRETDTMPNWAGSNWYFLRYTDPKNKKEFSSKKNTDYWIPVDLYNGGMEHTTLHLLYSRFWHKFLYDLKLVKSSEPYQKRISHGMVLGEGGIKMSKSRGNVVNPDDQIKKYGADSLRLYEMFMGPFDEAIPWDPQGIIGLRRFLERIWKVAFIICDALKIKKIKIVNNKSKLIHKTIKKVSEDMESFKFNTAISALMEYFNERDFGGKINEAEKLESNEFDKEVFKKFILLLWPFAPHISQEIWQMLGEKTILDTESWPQLDKNALKTDKFTLVIQINGKVRSIIEIPINTDEKTALNLALNQENIKKYISDKTKIKKTIFIPNKLINIII